MYLLPTLVGLREKYILPTLAGFQENLILPTIAGLPKNPILPTLAVLYSEPRPQQTPPPLSTLTARFAGNGAIPLPY